jgi:hypothetical protein
VTERHDVCIELPPYPLEKRVPGFPGGILDRSALATRARPHVFQIRRERHIERTRHGGRKLLIALGVAPQLMVEVRGADQANVARSVKITQDQREGD